MKKIGIMALMASLLALTACGAPIEHNEKVYPTYGLFNENESKSEDMCYEVSVGNVVWSIILIETVVAPIYFVGFSLYNPIGPKDANGKCGIDSQ